MESETYFFLLDTVRSGSLVSTITQLGDSGRKEDKTAYLIHLTSATVQFNDKNKKQSRELKTGKMQNDHLYDVLKDKVKNVYLIGDAKIGGARITNAMYDAQRIGRAL